MAKLKGFINGKICVSGRMVEEAIYVDEETGLIVPKPDEMPQQFIDLEGAMIAPAFIELQTNGALGFHFTQFDAEVTYQQNLQRVSHHYVTHGVGSYYMTLPTIRFDVLEKIISYIHPQPFENGATLLGVHCEGPWLSKGKRGAHDASLLMECYDSSSSRVYDSVTTHSCVKMVTLAPEVAGAVSLIKDFHGRGIVVSLGHSAATYEIGTEALEAGATMLTHVFNAMDPLHHRAPSLPGLIVSKHAPFYSVIADGIHLHPAVVAIAFRSNPDKCILISDSIELAGMPDGVYPGHAQIPQSQQKHGGKVTIRGTETLIGSCCGMDECVRNLVHMSDCTWPEAIRCASENIVELMDVKDRGKIEPGRRADFVILDVEGNVTHTWINGQLMYERIGKT